MIYSPRHDLLFLKTMKTAGTSIEIELSRHVEDDAIVTPIYPGEERRVERAGRGAQNHIGRRPVAELGARGLLSAAKRRRWPTEQRYWNHMTAAEIRDRLPRWADLQKVCVVRNPWDVFASRFHMHSNWRDDINTVDDLIEQLGVKGNWPIYTIKDEIVVDHAIRFERLADDLPVVFEVVGMSIGSLSQAKSGQGRPHYRDVLEQRHVELVAEVCKREIEHFGFEF